MLNLRGAVDEVANSRGRTTSHIVTGLAITAGAVALSAVIARLTRVEPQEPEVYSDYEEPLEPAEELPPPVLASFWPPLFMAITLSGFRIWNAPPSFRRAQALTLWGLVQLVNGAATVLTPRKLGGRLAAAGLSLFTALAYASRAKRVDPAAAGMLAPYLGAIALANLATDELWKRAVKPGFEASPQLALLKSKAAEMPSWLRH